MRAFDLHVRVVNRDNAKELEELVALAQTLTFAGLALDSPTPVTPDLLKGPLKLIRRQTLAPRSATRLKQYIEKNRKQAEVLVIHGRTKPIWLAAAEVPMVDMVMLRDFNDFTRIDSQIARTMTTYKKPVEVCLNGLLTHHGTARSKLIRVMTNALEHLVRAKCSLILTSGAGNQWELRAPRDLAALGYLVNIPENFAKMAIFDNPLELLSNTMGFPKKNLLKQEKRKS